MLATGQRLDGPERCERAEVADFSTGSFDAVIAWDVLFHLSEAGQRDVIENVADWLRPGGRFLFTSVEAKGTTQGNMNGVALPYTSLGVGGYRDVIENARMRLTVSYHDEWDNDVYIAEKAA